MKQYLLKPCILFVCISSILLFPKKSYGQLNGNYTINPAKSASNTNYRNWASAVGDLVSGSRTDGGTAQGAGVSGAVVFSVYDTLYDNTSISITAISGASYANTITFKSTKGDSSKCRLRYPSGTATTDDYVLLLDGADYITFRQIGFERTGTNTYSTVIQITNDADNNKFVRCFMKGRKMASSSGLGFAYGIGSCFYFLGNADSIQLTQNRMMYGYNGIYNPNACTAATYSGNLIDTSGSAGIYTTGQTSLRIMNNTFNMGDFGAGSGHYTSYGIRVETSPGLLISGNKLLMTAVNSQVCRALVIASNGSTSTSTTPLMIYNNSIYNSGGTGNCTGLAVYNSFFMNFYYNNVLINNSLAEGAAYYQYYGSYTNGNLNLVNNNLINKGAGYAIDVRDAVNYANIDSFDYNNIYSAGTYMAYWNGTKYTNLSGFQSGSAKGTYSLSLDPGFVSNSDLHVSNIAINGKAIPYPKVQTDIDNETRNATTPDIGSDEFFPIANDAGISGIDSPSLFCAGKKNVKVRFQNYGYDTIRNIQIAWSVNGTAQTGISWSGKLAPGQSSPSLNLGPYSFSSNTAYNFKIWTKSPNSAADGKNNNDTLKLTRYAAMSGSYTIGDTSIANYKSFSQAITAMTERGLCGAVTFNVFNGTYNEQVGLAQLSGMGPGSPLLFQSISKDSSKVKITLASTIANGSNNAALQLRGADYVTFKGITFERTGTNIYAHVIHILNGSDHNTFTNCRMLGIPVSTASLTAYNIWSDQTQDNYNTFKNNYIKNGTSNMQYAGVSNAHEVGTIIQGNVFEGAFRNGVQLLYTDSAIISGNTFLNILVSDSATNDLTLYDCDRNGRIDGNFFKDVVAENAMRLSFCNASSTNPAFISNNSIVKNAGTTAQTNKGIFLNGVDYYNVVFNSIYFNGSSTTNAGVFSSAASTSNVVLKNNNIVMEGGEVVRFNSAAHIISSNNNNFYAKGTQFAYWGATYNTLTDLVTATGKDALSLSIDPFFISSTNLHIRNPLMKGAGAPVTGITTDIDGETRNNSTPDIGADEFKLVPNDAGIVGLTKPVAGTCAGVLSVETVIKNIGGDTLKTATITWSVNGIAQTPYNWKGKKLPTGARDTFVLGTYNFIGIVNPKFIIKSNMPNGQTDGISFNDSIITNRAITALPAALAGADDTICLGDQLTLGPSPLTSLKYKWYDMSNVLIDSVAQIIVKPNFKTEYVLEVTNKTYGCTKRDTVTITVNNIPAVDAGPDVAVCLGASAQIGRTPVSGFTYSWTSSPAGFISAVANPTVTPSSTTTYTLVKTIKATGCKASDAAVVTVNLPPASKINGTSSVCDGEVVSYNTKQNTGNTYKWSVTGGQIVGTQNTGTINVRWNAAGAATLQVIETNTATCKDTAGYNITVNPRPSADFSAVGFCKDNSTVFTNKSTGATANAWAFGDGGTSTQLNPAHLYATTGSFAVALIIKNSFNCADTAAKIIIINPLPVVKFSITKTAEKEYHFVDSSTIASGTIAKWDWDFGDGNTLSMFQTPTHVYSTAGSFDITLCVTSAAGCKTCVTQNFNVVGLRNITLNNTLYAVPNPGTGMFRISANDNMQSAVVTNITGQIIATMQPGTTSLSIDLSNQPAGIYFVKITAGDQMGTIKLIKQ